MFSTLISACSLRLLAICIKSSLCWSLVHWFYGSSKHSLLERGMTWFPVFWWFLHIWTLYSLFSLSTRLNSSFNSNLVQWNKLVEPPFKRCGRLRKEHPECILYQRGAGQIGRIEVKEKEKTTAAFRKNSAIFW